MNTSPDRGSFFHKGLTTTLDNDAFSEWEEDTRKHEASEEWRKDNMEYDLRSTQWITEKAKADNVYAQHMYAAICNNEFIKNDVWPILTGKTWGASWRHAGGIVANMQEKGDYIDWYCSGIRGDPMDDERFRNLSKEQQELYLESNAYVSESTVTEEIREDLLKLGWIVLGEKT